MATLLGIFRFAARNGVPADDTTNTVHIQTSGVDVVASASAAGVAFADFFLGIDQYLSHALSGTFTGTWYDLADPQPRVPVFSTSYGATITATQPLPDEVAACMSFKASAASGVNPRRRKNRIYIGPLNVDALSAAGSGEGRPSAAFIAACNTAADALKATSDGSAIWEWVGYSPTDAVNWALSACWMDDAFDTQRRRGRSPTAKTVFFGTI